MTRRLVAAVFCDPPRPVPHARLLSVVFRTVHLAAFGLLLGGHAFGVPPARLVPSLWLTVGSGAALMGLETAASARWLLEGRGLAIVVKVVLLVAVAAAWEHRVPLLLAVVVLAGITSHMPGRFRHASLLTLWRGAARSAALAGVHSVITPRESRHEASRRDGRSRPHAPHVRVSPRGGAPGAAASAAGAEAGAGGAR